MRCNNMVSIRLEEWRRYFAQVAKMCSQQVAGLPKGEKLRAFRECMSRYLKGKHPI